MIIVQVLSAGVNSTRLLTPFLYISSCISIMTFPLSTFQNIGGSCFAFCCDEENVIIKLPLKIFCAEEEMMPQQKKSNPIAINRRNSFILQRYLYITNNRMTDTVNYLKK